MIRVTGSVRLKTCLINSNCIFNINIWQLAKPSCENIYTNPLESGLHCVISALLNGESGQSWGAAQPVIGFAEKTASSWSHAHSHSLWQLYTNTPTHTLTQTCFCRHTLKQKNENHPRATKSKYKAIFCCCLIHSHHSVFDLGVLYTDWPSWHNPNGDLWLWLELNLWLACHYSTCTDA